jgi:uncharacterized protein HemX
MAADDPVFGEIRRDELREMLGEILRQIESLNRKVSHLTEQTSEVQTDLNTDSTELGNIAAAILSAVTGIANEISSLSANSAVDTSGVDAQVAALQAAANQLQALVPAPAAPADPSAPVTPPASS